MTQNVNLIAKAVKEHFGANESAVKHFVSVYTLAKTIGELEKLPQETQEYLELEAILCDIKGDTYKQKSVSALTLMQQSMVEFDIAQRVCYVIEHFDDYDHISGLDHQILLEAHAIVDFKEHNADTAQIAQFANAHFMTNYGKAFLKKAFNL